MTDAIEPQPIDEADAQLHIVPTIDRFVHSASPDCPCEPAVAKTFETIIGEIVVDDPNATQEEDDPFEENRQLFFDTAEIDGPTRDCVYYHQLVDPKDVG